MEIQVGKYYKTDVSDVVIKATTYSNGADSFRGILIEDPKNIFPNKLNKETTGWNSEVFYEIEYNTKENNNKQYSKFMLLCAK